MIILLPCPDTTGIEGVEFVCGRAEDVLQGQLEEEAGEGSSGEVIGVVDPPRAGLRTSLSLSLFSLSLSPPPPPHLHYLPPLSSSDPRVVQCIRRHSQIQRLVYVSCNPEGHQTLGNFVE